MDQPEYSLQLVDGLEIYGKLVIPDGVSVKIIAPLIVVHGELHVTSTKPIDGSPTVRITMQNGPDNYFEPTRENSQNCNGRCLVGSKAIVVAGGKINMQGIPNGAPTWVPLLDVLDRTVIVVDLSVLNVWAVGAEVLLTSFTTSMDQHQVRRITRISQTNGGVALQLDQPIERPTTLKESMDYATEVALLSRNIVFEDDGSSIESFIGGHFIILETPNVVQHIEGVEIVGFGQQGILGRYPIHFHLCDDVKKSMVLRNTVRQSYQRCIVLHATDNAIVQENVTFDTKGHCYVIEDGVERYNSFVKNLGVFVNMPKTTVPGESDYSPSIFWITNTLNSFVGNVAAGSASSGYWFELFKRGIKANLLPNLDPKAESLLRFENNIAHSIQGFSLRSYPSGYAPRETALIYGFRSFRNSRGLFFHRSSNIHLVASIIADNQVGVDVDRADNIVIRDTTFIGQSILYKDILERQNLGQRVCSASHIGLEIHTHRDRSSKGLQVEDCVFVGFAHLPCEDAVPLRLDDTTVTGTFNMFTTFRNVSFENGADRADFCVAFDAGINDVYLTDLDGSLNYPFKVSNDPATLLSNHRNMLEFIDVDACVLYEDRCYQYCPQTCFRTVRCEIDPAETSDLLLRVCGSFSDSCIFVQGRLYESAEDDSSFYPRIFLAHVPKGRYSVTIVSEVGLPVWPSFVNVYLDQETCNDGISFGDVSILTPVLISANTCNELIRNGNFEQSKTKPSYWLSRRGGKLQIVQGPNRSNALSGAIVSPELAISQYLDNRCLIAGTWYVIRANIQVMEGTKPIVCNPINQPCPQIGLYTEEAGFQFVGTVDPWRFDDTEYNVEGFLQIDSLIDRSSAVSLYIASRQRRAIVVDNVVMSRINDPNAFCQNLIRGFSNDIDQWKGLWKSNDRSSMDKVEVVSPGYLSPTALRFSKRAISNEGPLYTGMRTIERHCLKPGSKWLLEGYFALVDRSTGLQGSCDPTKRNACPSIRIFMWDATTQNRVVVQQRTTTYTTTTWNPTGFNQLQGKLELPSDAEWDGSVGGFNLDIVGFPANFDLIFDQVKMTPVVS